MQTTQTPFDWNQVLSYLHGKDIFLKIGLALVEVLAAYVIGSLIKTLILRISGKAPNKGILTFFASFCNITIKISGIIIALDQIGVAMNLIIGALSAFGVGISLALKDNMASVASGLQILLTKPFKVGDYIKIGSHEGRVESIEMTYITLLTRNNEIDIVPNNKVISKILKNFSSEPKRKIGFKIQVPKDQIDQTIDLLETAADKCSLVCTEPKPLASLSALTMKEGTVELICYALQNEYWEAYKEVLKAIHEEDLKTEDPAQTALEKTSAASEESKEPVTEEKK